MGDMSKICSKENVFHHLGKTFSFSKHFIHALETKRHLCFGDFFLILQQQY